MLDLICVGEILIDFLPGGEPGIYICKAGGAPANVAIAASRNGLKTGFCGKAGEDDFGRFLFQTLRENDVAVLCPEPVKEAVTTMAFVTLREDGERSFTFARKPGADMFLTQMDVDACNIIRHNAFYTPGSCSLSKPPASDATENAMSGASKSGILVSFDVNYRDLLWDADRPAAIRAYAAYSLSRLLKISEEELDLLAARLRFLQL